MVTVTVTAKFHNPSLSRRKEWQRASRLYRDTVNGEKLEVPDGRGQTDAFVGSLGFQQALASAEKRYSNVVESSRDQREKHFNFLALYSSTLGVGITILSLAFEITMLSIVGLL